MQTIESQLTARLAEAFAAVLGQPADTIDATIRPATDPKFGDYQCNAAMALAKRAKRNPRQLAEQAVAAAKLDDLALPPEIAGPGFINLRLKNEFLGTAVATVAADDRLGVSPAAKPETVVVDFSSPNISKEMHIGHLRSTVLGDVVSRVLECLGHRVVRQNHVGDWGTQFGMLLAYLRQDLARLPDRRVIEPFLQQMGTSFEISMRETEQTRRPHIVSVHLADLEDFYRRAKEKFDSDAEFASEARHTVTQLQSGDPECLRHWRMFHDESLRHCQAMYARLGVSLQPGDVRGESDYNADLPAVIDALDKQGLLVESEGAKCVFLDGFTNKEGNPRPFIVQKTGGGYLYATTDLAAVRYRVATFKPSRVLYVTDSRQADHFAYMFAVARKAGFAPDNVQLVHVAFGTIQGPDGKPFKTKSGENVKLADVLDEAEARARKIVDEKNPDLSADEKAAVARAVGIGAVKYFDLSNNRLSDYRFDWDQMLALTGNTAPYLQYAYARVRSIFRKGGLDEQADAGRAPALTHDKERALALHLLRFGEVLAHVLDDYRPNMLCDYLYELAIRFSGFYEACPVLKADEPTRSERLLLSNLTARVMKQGLDLLGIDVREQM